jgi:hypothetical protein
MAASSRSQTTNQNIYSISPVTYASITQYIDFSSAKNTIFSISRRKPHEQEVCQRSAKRSKIHEKSKNGNQV